MMIVIVEKNLKMVKMLSNVKNERFVSIQTECCNFEKYVFEVFESSSFNQLIWCCVECRSIVRDTLNKMNELESKIENFDKKIKTTIETSIIKLEKKIKLDKMNKLSVAVLKNMLLKFLKVQVLMN